MIIEVTFRRERARVDESQLNNAQDNAGPRFSPRSSAQRGGDD